MKFFVLFLGFFFYFFTARWLSVLHVVRSSASPLFVEKWSEVFKNGVKIV